MQLSTNDKKELSILLRNRMVPDNSEYVLC